MKKLIILQIALVGIITAFSCTKEKIPTYNGPDLVEIAPPFTRTVYTPTIPYPDSVKLQLVSRQLGNDTKVTYVVDTATRAVAGTDYQITGTTGETVLPANNSFTFIKYNILPVTASKKLVFKLTSNEALKVSENFKLITLTIAPTPVIFTLTTKTIQFNGGTGVIRDTIRIRLNQAAARFKQPVPLNYTVEGASTAVEGTDYSFVSTKGVSNVPANSADALVILDINPVATDKTLILNLADVPGISLATATRKITYTIKP